MSYYRTPEHRAMRAELIKRWKPWEKSTGPKSLEGKERAAMRGYKGGTRVLFRALAGELRRQEQWRKTCLDTEVKIELINESSVDKIVG